MARRKDPRPFIAVHDDIDGHPKIEPLSDAAFRHLVRLWGWCHRFGTDGIVPETRLKAKGPKIFKELTTPAYPGANPLAIPATEGMWEMRDYLKHQWSQAEIDEQAARNKANGARGGRPRKDDAA
jgi:hypothetical protein